MTQTEASALLVELVQAGIRRGVYSSIEVKAIQEALQSLQTANNDFKDEAITGAD